MTSQETRLYDSEVLKRSIPVDVTDPVIFIQIEDNIQKAAHIVFFFFLFRKHSCGKFTPKPIHESTIHSSCRSCHFGAYVV